MYGSERGAISDGRPYRDSWELRPGLLLRVGSCHSSALSVRPSSSSYIRGNPEFNTHSLTTAPFYLPARKNLPVVASTTPTPFESLRELPYMIPHTSCFDLASQSSE